MKYALVSFVFAALALASFSSSVVFVLTGRDPSTAMFTGFVCLFIGMAMLLFGGVEEHW